MFHLIGHQEHLPFPSRLKLHARRRYGSKLYIRCDTSRLSPVLVSIIVVKTKPVKKPLRRIEPSEA